MGGLSALSSIGVKPVELEAKEGLALNNGTQAMTAIGVLALYDAEVLAKTADIAAAMTLEAVKGKSAPFDPQLHRIRPHAGQSASAARIRRAIQGSTLVDVVDADTEGKVQDSYSIRCVPQVHGASQDAMAYVRQVLETEINSATDNPLIFTGNDRALSGGNFHGQPVALVMDFLALATAELGSISERRTAKLMDHHHNAGLPPFLAANGGIQSGLMIAQYTAAALVSENKVLMHPASGDSIPTSANQEDHVSMGTIAARHAANVVDNVRTVLAIELLSAATALRLRKGKSGKGTAAAVSLIEKTIPPRSEDRELSDEIAKVDALIRSGKLADIGS
jgi:histidine ammonia-lyase